MDPVPQTAVDRSKVRLLVAADHGLVAESIHVALSTLGYDAALVRHRKAGAAAGAARAALRRPRRPLKVARQPDVALLLSDLDRAERVRTAQGLISAWTAPWLVLTGAETGPVWGAVYERGARLVVPSSTGLEEVSRLLDELARGWVPRDATLRRGELIGAWRSFARDRDLVAGRLRTLTEREDEILRLLCVGASVREIAEGSRVSEMTVRSQVKSILRKLHVGSQIAAVALYQELHVEDTGHPVATGAPEGAPVLARADQARSTGRSVP